MMKHGIANQRLAIWYGYERDETEKSSNYRNDNQKDVFYNVKTSQSPVT